MVPQNANSSIGKEDAVPMKKELRGFPEDVQEETVEVVARQMLLVDSCSQLKST